MMTSKDFAEVAAVLSDLYSQPLNVDRGQIALVADELADRFETMNPRFNREIFLKAALVDQAEIEAQLQPSYEWKATHGREDWDYELAMGEATATVTMEGDKFVAALSWGEGPNEQHLDTEFHSLHTAFGWAEKQMMEMMRS